MTFPHAMGASIADLPFLHVAIPPTGALIVEDALS